MPTQLPPSSGIYYLVRFPDEWKLLVYRYTDGPELDHIGFWRTQVALQLAEQWHQRIGRTVMDTEWRLREWTHAFPRGRVNEQADGYVILHGNDLTTFMWVTRQCIEMAFGIGDRVHWQEDDHERCEEQHLQAVRRLLGLKETWPHGDGSH